MCPHTSRIEFNPSDHIGTSVLRTTTGEAWPIYLTFDARLTTGTRIRITVSSAGASAHLSGGPYQPAFVLFRGINFAHPSCLQQCSPLPGSDWLQETVGFAFRLGSAFRWFLITIGFFARARPWVEFLQLSSVYFALFCRMFCKSEPPERNNYLLMVTGRL